MVKSMLKLSAAALSVLVANHGLAQDYPSRTITLVVPFSAGGATDQVTRIAAAKATDILGASIIIENRPGGGGQIAIGAVKQTPADGYTLLIGDVGTHAINASLYSKLSYDPIKDFIPVVQLVEMPHVLVVPAASRFKTMDELIAAAREKPGSLTFGSVGIGSGAHLLAEMLKSQKGIDMVHLPYRGSAQIVPDLMENRIDLFFGAVGSMAPFIEAGQLRGLVITDKQRASLLPKVPTAAEAGVSGLDLSVWFGVLAPSGTPGEVVERLNAAFVRALNDPEIVQRLDKLGAKVVANKPGEFANVIAAETERLGTIVRSSGARLD